MDAPEGQNQAGSAVSVADDGRDGQNQDTPDADDNGEISIPEEGHSARLLRQAIDRTIDKTMSASKISLWAQAYPTIYHKRKEAITYISEKFRSLLVDNMKVEIETMFEEENIIGLLNSLDTLVEESNLEPDKIAWRPSGIPSEDVRSHLVAIKRKQRDNLQVMLKQVEADRTRREASVVQRQRTLIDMQEKLKGQVSAFQNAYLEVCEGERVARQFNQMLDKNC